MGIDETRFVERLQFFEGQRLVAGDLQGVEAFNRRMRWLHNRSLHQPGVGNGLAVRGDKGQREVWIGPGYAIDADGREIVLTQPVTLQVPPVAGDDDGNPVVYDLAVRYPDDADLEEAETRAGICDTHGVVRLREAPIFCWVRLERGQDQLTAQDDNLKRAIRKGMLITLARVVVLNCQLHGFVSIAERRDARPDCLPYIGCGVVDPTVWNIQLLAALQGASDRLLLTADIVTKEANFVSTPCYSASILGSRNGQMPNIDGEDVDVLLVDRVSVQDPSHDGFTAIVLVDRVHAPEWILPDEVDPAWFNTNWRLQWLGVEG